MNGTSTGFLLVRRRVPCARIRLDNWFRVSFLGRAEFPYAKIKLDNWCMFLLGKGKVSPVPRLDLIIGAGIHLGMGELSM